MYRMICHVPLLKRERGREGKRQRKRKKNKKRKIKKKEKKKGIVYTNLETRYLWRIILKESWSQWPPGLRRRSTTARLVRSWV
jgi:hypothetical protein